MYEFHPYYQMILTDEILEMFYDTMNALIDEELFGGPLPPWNTISEEDKKEFKKTVVDLFVEKKDQLELSCDSDELKDALNEHVNTDGFSEYMTII